MYLVDQLTADSKVYHKACFRCHHCKGTLKVITIKIESFEHKDTWGTLLWHWSFMVFIVLLGFFYLILYVCTHAIPQSCHFCTWLWIFLYLGFVWGLWSWRHELVWSTWKYFIMLNGLTVFAWWLLFWLWILMMIAIFSSLFTILTLFMISLIKKLASSVLHKWVQLDYILI